MHNHILKTSMDELIGMGEPAGVDGSWLNTGTWMDLGLTQGRV